MFSVYWNSCVSIIGPVMKVSLDFDFSRCLWFGIVRSHLSTALNVWNWINYTERTWYESFCYLKEDFSSIWNCCQQQGLPHFLNKASERGLVCHYGSARETGFATRLRSRETRSKLEALVLQIYRPNAWHAKENVKPRPDWSPSVHDTIMARA